MVNAALHEVWERVAFNSPKPRGNSGSDHGGSTADSGVATISPPPKEYRHHPGWRGEAESEEEEDKKRKSQILLSSEETAKIGRDGLDVNWERFHHPRLVDKFGQHVGDIDVGVKGIGFA